MAGWVEVSGGDGQFAAAVARPAGTPKAGVVVAEAAKLADGQAFFKQRLA